VCVVASNYPDRGRPASDGGDSRARLPFRTGDADHPACTGARAELRDSYAYYAELLVAVDGHGLSIPQPRAALDDLRRDLETDCAGQQSCDDMVARFDDTWT
jgi:hypothetical protein